MAWKFYLETFGCRVNQYESNLLRQAWARAGGEPTTQPELADYILINTCAITRRAERDGRNAVSRLRKQAPQAKIFLTGCAAQFYAAFTPRKDASWSMPDYCVVQSGKSQLHKGPLAFMASAAAPEASLPGPAADWAVQQYLCAYDRARPVVKIQDGCSQGCAYCIVPQTRGKPRSRQREDILAECQQLARQGYGELVLSGINLRQYAGNFWELLSWLDNQLTQEFAQDLRLRISSIDPVMLNWHAMQVLSHARLICPHLHLSLQHGSDKILAGMGRGHYSAESVEIALQNLACIWPQMGIGADFIVGFPGETLADVEQLLDFIATIPLSYAHVFPYSARQGTRAAQMPGQVAKVEKEKRAARVRALIQKKKEAFWQEQLKLAEMRLVMDGSAHGVNEYFTPCSFADAAPEGRGLVGARPVSVGENGLVVMPA